MTVVVLVELLAIALYIAGSCVRVSSSTSAWREDQEQDEFIRALHAEPIGPFDGRDCHAGDGTPPGQMVAFDETHELEGPIRVAQAMAEWLGPEIGQAQGMFLADQIEMLCHWEQNRGGVADGQVHWAFHFGFPCPYHVVAEYLRGHSDPRTGLGVEVVG